MKATAKKNMNSAKSKNALEEKIRQLPPEDQKEIADFVEFLLNRSKRKVKKGKMTFSWEGALSHLAKKYTSVELQHKITRDWGKI